MADLTVVHRLARISVIGTVVGLLVAGCGGGGKRELDLLLADPMASPVLGFGEVDDVRVEFARSGEFIQSDLRP